ncbi:2-amino-4-hydroxy-6-hydroxymethyldihydropteridine diphosphokinase [Dechloromonas sp. HYN0024]|uniref:2-amino-4-hydroxy-6- hydroxymethyldihydropteridine diphosphokinase n=1 Tax=Dechloromonas sp. HYN0024 TaxID=2231055 RepID=UPI000E451F72|nr:2-amino-4-hydroxy-6-hydroxymethyldihydropteridine diphosphokinase [Dechloromonas sp. HYN0024]AXS79286.1 2-amino-4-hydroxy-6-hydroxymethyldihydropteridine diphosphokinase [Dechloromonas sp. HYN0024]
MNTAFVALGANLGDPAATVRAAFAALSNLSESRIVHSSSLYRTAPVGITEQPAFINAVAQLETTLAPEALLDALFDIELRFGRIRADKNGPRTLDLDLLLYDDQFLELPRLTLPHPRLHLRAFVLCPLAEIAPHLSIPGRGTVAAWLPAVANQDFVKL